MLEAFCRLEIPEGGWEIIAVDNASTDHTADIIKCYVDKLPIIYLYERRPGKNNALNLGLPLAKGELIVFTDDDIIPLQDWLIILNRCASDHPDYTIFGGVIRPNWPREPEDWILNHVPLGVTFALTEENRTDGEIPPNLVWGPNMAIRKAVFDLGYSFNCNIGPNGKNYVMGSETEFTLRLGEAGYKSWFCKSAVVQHIIRDYQLDPKWIVKRAYRFGRGAYRRDASNFVSNSSRIFKVPRWIFRKLFGYYALYVLTLVTRDRLQMLNSLWEINYMHGYIFELIKGTSY